MRFGVEQALQQGFVWAHLGLGGLYLVGLWAVALPLARRAAGDPRRSAFVWRLLCGPAAFLAIFAGVGALHLDQRLLVVRWIHLWAALFAGLMAVDGLAQWALTRGRLAWFRPLTGALAALSVGLLVVGLVRPGAGA